MGTSSGSQQQQQQQQTVSQPWAPAQPALQSILSSFPQLQANAGINGTEAAAIQQLTQNAGGIPNFGPTVANTATNFLSGDPFNVINPAYSAIGQGITGSGITNPNNLNPFNTPGFAQALQTSDQDITNQINGQFAGAGRTGSGQDTQTLARGLAQGNSAAIASQYNQNVTNMLSGLQDYFNAGIGANNALGGNVNTGASLAGNVPSFATQGPATLLSAGQAPFNLLSGNQGILANLATPIASLGGQTNSQGTSNTQTSQTPSILSDILASIGTVGRVFNPAKTG